MVLAPFDRPLFNTFALLPIGIVQGGSDNNTHNNRREYSRDDDDQSPWGGNIGMWTRTSSG